MIVKNIITIFNPNIKNFIYDNEGNPILDENGEITFTLGGAVSYMEPLTEEEKLDLLTNKETKRVSDGISEKVTIYQMND